MDRRFLEEMLTHLGYAKTGEGKPGMFDAWQHAEKGRIILVPADDIIHDHTAALIVWQAKKE